MQSKQIKFICAAIIVTIVGAGITLWLLGVLNKTNIVLDSNIQNSPPLSRVQDCKSRIVTFDASETDDSKDVYPYTEVGCSVDNLILGDTFHASIGNGLVYDFIYIKDLSDGDGSWKYYPEGNPTSAKVMDIY